MGISSRSPEYDYVIAGGGSAGCVLAARLCEDPSARVLLVEAGRHGRSLFSRMPVGNGILIGNRHFDWGFESAPQKSMHGSRLYLPRGLRLGGSSLLDGMIYIRATPRITTAGPPRHPRMVLCGGPALLQAPGKRAAPSSGTSTRATSPCASQSHLADYQHFYNHLRPHCSPDLRTPMQYLQQHGVTQPSQSHMY